MHLARQPLREITNVFQADVIAAAFEGEFPPLRVLYCITPKDPDWVVDYPLEDLPQTEPELPGPVFRDCEHPAAHYARVYLDAIYKGDLAPLVEAGNSFTCTWEGSFRQIWEQFGNRGALAWARHGTYEDYFSFFEIHGLNNSLVEADKDELDAAILTAYWVLENYPEYSLWVLPAADDVVDLMLFRAWLLGDRQGPCGLAPLN